VHSEETIEAFKGDALMLADLMHPNLPHIYDHFMDTGRWYLVMDFIEGETLEEHLSKVQGGYLPLMEEKHYAHQDAIQFSAGFVMERSGQCASRLPSPLMGGGHCFSVSGRSISPRPAKALRRGSPPAHRWPNGLPGRCAKDRQARRRARRRPATHSTTSYLF